MFEVRLIEDKKQVEEWLTKKHYARRKCNIMYCYGAFLNNKLEGIITFGMPPTPFFSKLFGKGNYLELNRLITNDGLEKNILSRFVSESLKLIKQIGNFVIISYADPNAGHTGFIYQSTNFIYTGAGRVNQKDKRGVNKFFYNDKEYHERHIKENMVKLKFKINPNKTKNENWINNGGVIKKQKRKHRYFYIVGSQGFRRKMKKVIYSHFDIYPYPKDPNINYDASYDCETLYLEDIL